MIRRAHEAAARSSQSGDSADICTLPIAALKDLIVARGLRHDDCIERRDLIRRAHEAARRDPALDGLRRMSADELRRTILSAGLKSDDCRDTEALVQRAAQAKVRLAARYNYQRGDGNEEALRVGTAVYNGSARTGAAYMPRDIPCHTMQPTTQHAALSQLQHTVQHTCSIPYSIPGTQHATCLRNPPFNRFLITHRLMDF